jgi:hypothetical protein
MNSARWLRLLDSVDDSPGMAEGLSLRSHHRPGGSPACARLRWYPPVVHPAPGWVSRCVRGRTPWRGRPDAALSSSRRA